MEIEILLFELFDALNGSTDGAVSSRNGSALHNYRQSMSPSHMKIVIRSYAVTLSTYVYSLPYHEHHCPLKYDGF